MLDPEDHNQLIVPFRYQLPKAEPLVTKITDPKAPEFAYLNGAHRHHVQVARPLAGERASRR